ncbi:MAG: NUDIX domain-containing protein [Methylococcaceae bacterium]|nr:NUDIX domain-containing protein [Methylococcaceae bacterium]
MTDLSGSTLKTPFSDFRFCSRCGATGVSVYGERAIRCADCGFKFYFNAASAVGGFVFHQGKLILAVRGQNPQKGMLDLPGGFVEYDETLEDALRREILEELNIRVSNLVYLTSAPNDYLYAEVLYKITDAYFLCEVEDIAGIEAKDDVAAYVLLAPEELDPQRLAFPPGRVAFRQLLEFLENR